MAEILERVTRIEVTLEHQNETLEKHGDILTNLDQKLDDVRRFISRAEGAEIAKKLIAERLMQRATHRHYFSVGIAGFLGAVAGAVASIIAFLNRYSPVIN